MRAHTRVSMVSLAALARAAALLSAVACSSCQNSDSAGAGPQPMTGGAPGPSGAAASGGSSGAGGVGGVSGTGAAGGVGGAPTASGGASGAGGTDGGSGGAVAEAGNSGANASGGVPGCASNAYPVCLDFESGRLDAPWTLGSGNSAGTSAHVETGLAAHGQYALHLTGFHMGTSTLIHISKLGNISDVMWGRYYLYMDPGAPTGHGGMVRAFDQAGDWYELGFEYNSFLGNWHPHRPNPGGWIEKAMRSHDNIQGKSWICVEFLFDGKKPDVAQIWYDGVQVQYYSVIDYCDSGQGAAAGCNISLGKATQFTSFDVGAEFYHGVSLDPTMWAGDGPPTITDAYIDDIALDTKRVGCL